MDQERREQDKRMEKFMMMQDKKFQEEMKRISVDTGMMMAKYIADTRETIREESQKVSRQLAQNALDLEGIRKRMYTMDMDLQATGEVAASTSGYLAQVTSDYKKPDTVDYEPIISPDATQVTPIVNRTTRPTGSPPFGEARPR